MKVYFDNLRLIKRTDFFKRFKIHAKERKRIDQTEKQILKTLQDAEDLELYMGTINEKGLENLILPHHAVELEPGREPDRPVKVGGEQFNQVIRSYVEDYVPNSKFPLCTKKVMEQKAHFFRTDHSILKADFLFACNQRELAHPGNHYDDHHGQHKIYIGNGFHRFVAYGLWISEYGFKPLELFYVIKNDSTQT